MAEIIAHPWLRGRMPSDEEVQEEFVRRQETIKQTHLLLKGAKKEVDSSVSMNPLTLNYRGSGLTT